MARYLNPVAYAPDSNGDPRVGAKLYFYETGTTTPKTIYSDDGLTVPTTNPQLSDSNGQFTGDIYLDGIYKVLHTDIDDVTIWTKDPIGATSEGQWELWSAANTYNIPDIVLASDDSYYQSKVDANIGNNPTTSPTQWEKIGFILDDALSLEGGLTVGTIAGVLSVDDVTDSTSTVTGSIHTDGGLGVVKDIFAGADVNIAGSLDITAFSETIASYSIVTGTIDDLDVATATYFYPSGAMTALAYEFVFTNPVLTGRNTSFTLELNSAGIATSIAWPAGVKWSNGVEPGWTAAGIDFVVFVTRDGGTNWYGFSGGLDMS